MRGMRQGRPFCFALVLAGLAPSLVWAQDVGGAAAAAPPRGAGTAAVKRLDLRLSLAEAYDRTLISETGSVLSVDPHFRSAATFSAANVALNFSSVSRAVSFGAVAATNLRHFSATRTSLQADYYGALNVSTRLGRTVTAHAAQRVSYSPYYSLVDVLQGRELAPDDVLQPDQSVVRFDTFRAASSAGLTWTANGRTSVNAQYLVDVVDAPGTYRGALTQGSTLGMSRQLTEYAQLRLGYGYRRSELGSLAAPFETHDLGTGVSYRRPLSFSRRTLVSFDTGAALVVSRSHTFIVTGGASLAHQLGRTWASSLSYRRGVAAYAGVSHPFVVDATTGTLSGQATRKLALALSTGYTLGRAAIDIDNGFAAVFGRGRLDYRVARYLPVFAEYVYYDVRFERPTGLAAGFPTFVSRHGVRAGLSYGMPLLGSRPR